jgi:hypothetical protein
MVAIPGFIHSLRKIIGSIHMIIPEFSKRHPIPNHIGISIYCNEHLLIGMSAKNTIEKNKEHYLDEYWVSKKEKLKAVKTNALFTLFFSASLEDFKELNTKSNMMHASSLHALFNYLNKKINKFNIGSK